MEQELRDLYYDPKTGYQSTENLWKRAKEKGIRVSRQQVRDWLKNQSTYVLHKQKTKVQNFVKTKVRYLGEQLQLDLIDMSIKYKNSKGEYKSYEYWNNGYRWILTGIEILSRTGFAVPVRRKDTKNMSGADTEILNAFHDRFNKLPSLVQFDEGKEFYNVGVKELLKKNDITYFSTKSERKAAVVERFNRTLKERMWKYIYAKVTRRWLDVLDDLVEGYNSSVNRSVGMAPEQVNENNWHKIWLKLYGNPVILGTPKFKVGDRVHVVSYKSIFTKGYINNFLEEEYEISRVIIGDPTVYELMDPEDEEPIFWKWYEKELE